MLPRALNEPQPLEVQAVETPGGPAPRLIRWRGRWRRVVGIDDVWHVDDLWWRGPDEEVQRRYFLVRLEGDVPLTLFMDRLRGGWYSQRGAAVPGAVL